MTTDPNVLIALSLLTARQAPKETIQPGFANPGGMWGFHDAEAFRTAWAIVDAPDCEKHCWIAVDGFWCSICGQPQVMTWGGLNCVNGHGGAESVHQPWADEAAADLEQQRLQQGIDEAYAEERAVWDFLPGDTETIRVPQKHQWVDHPTDPAGHQCAVCGIGDLDEQAMQLCQGKG